MFKRHLLEIIVFISGATVMIFELAGSRVLGPYIGTSIFVWTAIIGVILGSMSFGYWYGGRIADKKPTIANLALILLIAALFIALTTIIKDFVTVLLITYIASVKIVAVVASVILFTPTSIMLGMVSPYAVRLKMESVKTSGRTVGNLYALSTVGSITGTFVAGFYLIPSFGTTNILVIISGILVALSMLAYIKKLFKAKIVLLSFLAVVLVLSNYQQYVNAQNGQIDTDTEYSRVKIWDEIDQNGNYVRRMQINNEHSSAMFLDKDELAYEYTKYYDLAEHFNPGFKSALMIGGAGYSYPKHFLKNYTDKTIDVVEIDPKITELAFEYFDVDENPRMNIFHEDGRTYLNSTEKKYDVIYGDAFKSFIVPYQLTTREAVQRQYDILNDNGVVVLNLISAINGEKGQLLRAEYVTFKSVFPQVYLFAVQETADGTGVVNLILVALKSEQEPSFVSEDPEIYNYLMHLWEKDIPEDMPVLTDEYAPVESFASSLIQ